ncbi:MAG: 2,3-bisphosphoglycerate-independent phosphoglycerate mutase [Alphaproteobacteria bacterium]|nr:2,3-bisphosphoglycerate-independent phosphoglycerate mutase [Alphaproteobacteria bacterium]
MNNNKKPLVLCILDGVGISAEKKHNAVALAKMPFWKELLKHYPNTRLNASGTAVGLPPGTMGNSEVGHITIGSGRVVNQFQRRFQQESESGRLSKNKELIKFVGNVKKNNGIVHIFGLMSDAGVHADINEAITVARIILGNKLKICVHFISDGRDTPPKSAEKYIRKLHSAFSKEIKSGQLFFGTLIGRYYAMDRNLNWDRTQHAFDAVVLGLAKHSAPDIKTALREAYARGETDEFIKPVLINGSCTKDICTRSGLGGIITASDGLLFTNFRADRARQIMQALAAPKTKNIKRPAGYVPPHALCFSQYGGETDNYCPALLPDIPIKNTLGDVLAAKGKSQLRISETEKYTHATYYIDGERTLNYSNEEKILIPSPNVPTFDLKPEMSANEITDKVLQKLSKFDVIIINYANGDIVGHTGVLKAAIRAMEVLDVQLSRLVPAVLKMGGTILITADHGNAEKMWNDKLNVPWTAHTTNKVPFVVVSDLPPVTLAKSGGIADIAPTMLKILGIKQPKEMTGKSLIKN